MTVGQAIKIRARMSVLRRAPLQHARVGAILEPAIRIGDRDAVVGVAHHLLDRAGPVGVRGGRPARAEQGGQKAAERGGRVRR